MPETSTTKVECLVRRDGILTIIALEPLLAFSHGASYSVRPVGAHPIVNDVQPFRVTGENACIAMEHRGVDQGIFRVGSGWHIAKNKMRMNKTALRLTVKAGLILALWLTTYTAIFAQSLPEGPGRAAFQRVCTTCHGADTATQMRLSTADWEGVISRMANQGANIKDADARVIVEYLAQHFGPDAPRTANAKQSSAEPASTRTTQPAEIPSSAPPPDIALLKSNGCLSCHWAEGQGGYTAPDLSNIGDSRTADELKIAILSPDQEVLPENRLVKVVTQQGDTLNGKLLNQNAFTIQFIDAKGRLWSLAKSDLRECTILTKGLMPSYKDKLTDAQIDALVQLLTTLKAAPGTP